MEPIKIEVKVNVAAVSELLSLLSSALNRTTAPEAAPAAKNPELPTPPSTDTPAAENPKFSKIPPATWDTPELHNRELTEVDVHIEIDRSRHRIEGEDYKENTSSEG